jgi:hypothetical protein
MNDKQDIGKQLLEYAEESAAFTAQRGFLDELFPYIFAASKRMSLRAIGRWLQAEHQISISPTTLAKAMRNADKYWIAILEEIEPAVRIVARAHQVSPAFVMSSENEIQFLSMQTPTLAGDGDAGQHIMMEYLSAIDEIKGFWNSTPSDALAECLAYVPKVFEDDNDKETEKAGGFNERTDDTKTE